MRAPQCGSFCCCCRNIRCNCTGERVRSQSPKVFREESAMKVSVFVGTSVDGFMARPDGGLDFLPPGGGEPHGYNEFIATVDALVIGRKTYETVLAFTEWPYG